MLSMCHQGQRLTNTCKMLHVGLQLTVDGLVQMDLSVVLSPRCLGGGDTCIQCWLALTLCDSVSQAPDLVTLLTGFHPPEVLVFTTTM